MAMVSVNNSKRPFICIKSTYERLDSVLERFWMTLLAENHFISSLLEWEQFLEVVEERVSIKISRQVGSVLGSRTRTAKL